MSEQQFKFKWRNFGGLLWLLLVLAACSDETVVGGITPTPIIPATASPAANSTTPATNIIGPTSTQTQMVALLPTSTPLPFDDSAPPATAIAATVLTPLVVAPTITPIIPTPKKFTPTPGPSPSVSSRVTPQTTPTPAGFGGDTQQLNDLRTTKITFLTAYTRAAKVVAATQPAAKIVLAQVNYFTPTHTGWSFYFVWPQGQKMYVATFDSNLANIAVTDDQSPILTQQAGQIQMERVLDLPVVVAKVVAAGVSNLTPIDSVYFEFYGTSPVPAYVCTNGLVQKQLIINAYTGQIIKNDFGK